MVVGALVGVLARPAAGEDPLFVDWTSVLPGLTSGYDPNSANDCTAGRIQCVDITIREMTKRFDRLAAACDHDTMFSLAYLRTTEQYKVAATTPGFFDDVNFVNHEDAVFARYYFDAYDAWAAGNVAATPKAWQVALDAADRKLVDGSTDMLLGINAHINRDLAYVLWQIGLVKPDGTSRKPDHDKVNYFLNQVNFFSEAHNRFDSSVSEVVPPGYMSAIQGWREEAWRNAERLRAAENDPVQLAQVKQSIEDAAYAEALSIKAGGLYVAPLKTTDARDAYCAAKRGS